MSNLHPQDTLTERELEVVRLMADGLTNREIGEQLFIGVETVRWYAKQIYGKLGAHSRKEAIQLAKQLGLTSDEPILEPAELRNNLPAQTTPFIGREKEIGDVLDLIADPDVRLVTILAPGGMGKTRLSLEIADRIVVGEGLRPSPTRTSFRDGVFFVALAPLRSPQAIYPAIAEAVGYEFEAERHNPEKQILDLLNKKQMLLIFDNFEHLLEGAAVVSDILQAAPDVKVIVTSRERLNLHGEALYNVGGMTVPGEHSIESIREQDSVKLLIDNASRIQPEFELTEDNVEPIARICELCAGMPLAIVLATAWLDVLTLEEIPREISASLDFLESEMRNTPERHHSIRAVFDPTWKRLSEKEQIAFMKLSIFRAGFTRDAAKAVAGADIRILQGLVNRALIQLSSAGRYDIHELLRQYARERLESTGEAENVRDDHSAYFLDFIAEREADIKGRRQIEALKEIEHDFENITAAWQWAVEHNHEDRISAALECLYWQTMLRDFVRGKALLEWTQEQLSTSRVASEWLTGRVAVRDVRSGLFLQHAQFKAEQFLLLAQTENDPFETAFCLGLMGSTARRSRAYEQAIAYYNQALELYHQLNDRFYISSTIYALSRCYSLTGHREKYVETIKQSADMALEHGNMIGYGNVVREMATLAFQDGALDQAARHYREALEIHREAGHLAAMAWNSVAVGWATVLRGELDDAQSYILEGLHIAKHLHRGEHKPFALSVLATVAAVREDYRLAQQLLAEARQLVRNPFTEGVINMCSGMIWCSLGEYQAAERAVFLWLRLCITISNTPALWAKGTTMLAAIEHHRDHTEYATELLSAGLNYPNESNVWIIWPFTGRLQDQLKAELGEEAYNAAWERGKLLDLVALARELVDGYEAEQE